MSTSVETTQPVFNESTSSGEEMCNFDADIQQLMSLIVKRDRLEMKYSENILLKKLDWKKKNLISRTLISHSFLQSHIEGY